MVAGVCAVLSLTSCLAPTRSDLADRINVCGQQYKAKATVVTVDAILGASQLQRHAESVRQLAVADRVVLTKGDLASAEERERRALTSMTT